MLYEESDNGSQ